MVSVPISLESLKKCSDNGFLSFEACSVDEKEQSQALYSSSELAEARHADEHFCVNNALSAGEEEQSQALYSSSELAEARQADDFPFEKMDDSEVWTLMFRSSGGSQCQQTDTIINNFKLRDERTCCFTDNFYQVPNQGFEPNYYLFPELTPNED